MKKTLAIVLALVMILSLATTAFAAGTGTITITGAHDNEDYSIYRIFDLVTYSGTNYSYKLSAKWADLEHVDGINAYFSVNTDGYIEWVDAKNNDAGAKEFAAIALKYAKDNSIVADGTVTADGDSVSFTGLDLGYYLVETSVGTVLALTTTDPNGEITEKNIAPTIDKDVENADTTTANVGDTVDFSVTINAKAGAENYVLHDTMSAGLTFADDSVKVYRGTVADANIVDDANYTVKTSGTCGCTFEVEFKQNYLDGITENTTLIVTYSATLNENAVVAGAGNTNSAVLKYGNDSKTTSSEATTYTYSFDLVKTDSDNKLLDGAKFVLYTDAELSNAVKLIAVSGGYRVADVDESGVTDIVVTDGKITISGLANGTYYLKETQAPDGYNLLSTAASFEISDSNKSATVSGDTWTNGGVHVVNNAGTQLPSTGGIGTTLFYIFGGILVVGAVVLLVTKKRMSVN